MKELRNQSRCLVKDDFFDELFNFLGLCCLFPLSLEEGLHPVVKILADFCE